MERTDKQRRFLAELGNLLVQFELSKKEAVTGEKVSEAHNPVTADTTPQAKTRGKN